MVGRRIRAKRKEPVEWVKRKERAWKSAREPASALSRQEEESRCALSRGGETAYGVRSWREEDAAYERSNRVRRFRPSCHQENMHRRHVADEGRSVALGQVGKRREKTTRKERKRRKETVTSGRAKQRGRQGTGRRKRRRARPREAPLT